MRSILILVVLFGWIPIVFLKPHVGIMLWTWLAYMNPHKISWGWAEAFALSEIVGGVTLIAWVLTKRHRSFPWDTTATLLVVFWVWTGVTTLTAFDPSWSFKLLQDFSKIMLFTLLTISLISTREQMQSLIWIIVISVGYFGFKGGFFSILTGGNYMIFGPPGTTLYDNNNLSTALIMVFPLIRYLHLSTDHIWVRRGLMLMMGLVLLSVITSYSRGGLIGLVAMMFMFWLRSRNRFRLLAIVSVLFAIILPLMPGHWYDRMGMIENYEEDTSATTRIGMWIVSIQLTKYRPIYGGGMATWRSQEMYQKYAPDHEGRQYSPHSIYFGILGEHGYVGLVLFIALGLSAFWSTIWIIRKSRDRPELQWARDFGRMMQVSLVGYGVPGAFLNLHYFDLYYQLLAITIIVRAIVAQQISETTTTEAVVTAPENLAPGSVAEALSRSKYSVNMTKEPVGPDSR